ncbi:Uncharacterized NAD(P)/FAD-binding protein YdhS [Micromonospora mirobrigensis]|uniref:Uncharacterized NAD(P)/FAD-binding protein YdhS n=2 Tax=Micromonospora mirobrigensis TaxID=262898 RepID=A0A1C4WYZ3_9ACTN|nr:Uncharacterized NAD(P)/FAD-binding protein YdhS [Micromonospora mirobrigensis]
MVTVFDIGEKLWRGKPYQADLPVLRINVPPEEMSVRADEKNHFRAWLEEQNALTAELSPFFDPVVQSYFFSREMYGDYLSYSAGSCLTALTAQGWRVDVVRERVERISPAERGLTLVTGDATRVTVDYAVVAVGAGQPPDAYPISGAPGYVANPYPARSSLAGIDPDAAVSILGSGLTAVDMVLALTSQGHRGPIHLTSRSGVLPSVRQRPVQLTLRHCTPEHLRFVAERGPLKLVDLVGIVRAELIEAGEDTGLVEAEIRAVRAENPVARLRRQLAEVDSPALGLRILQRAVPEAGPDLWPLLSAAERSTVLGTHQPTLMSLCCPMPPVTAATLLDLLESGQVTVIGGLREVTSVPGDGFRLVARGGTYRADHVINAINARARPMAESAEPLFRSLVRAGLAELHPNGGLCVDPRSSRLIAEGRLQQRLFALGDPAAGSLFFTFGVQSLVDRATDIVTALINDVGRSSGSPAAADATVLQPA